MKNMVICHEDKILKSFTESLNANFLKLLGINEKIIRPLPTELTEIKQKTRHVDYAGETIDGEIINLEFQSTKITEEDLKRFQIYNVLLSEKNKKPVQTYIICSYDLKNETNHRFIFEPINISLKNKNGDKRINIINNKIKNNEKVPKQCISELGILPLMGTKNNIETQINNVLEILNKITINNKTIEKEITGQLYLIIDKFIKNKNKRKNFMEKLKMKNTLLREYGNAIKKESKMEEKFEVAKNLIKENIPLKTIMKTTNLTKEEIESLK